MKSKDHPQIDTDKHRLKIKSIVENFLCGTATPALGVRRTRGGTPLRPGFQSGVKRHGLLFILICLIGSSISGFAQSPVTVIVADGLTVEDTLDPEAAQLYDLARHGELAAVNTAEPKAREFSAKTLPGLLVRGIPVSPDSASLISAAHLVGHLPAPLTLFHLPIVSDDRARSLRRLDILLYALRAETPNTPIYVLSTQPVEGGIRLGVVLASGEGIEPGLLISASTRTLGLLTNSDVRTLLYAQFATPDPVTAGRRLPRPILGELSGEQRLARVRELVYVAELNGQALHRVMPFLFVFVALLVFVAIGTKSRFLRFSPLLALNFPAALLFAPLLPPPTLWEYALRIVGWTVGLSLFAILIEKKSKFSASSITGFVLILTVTLDLITGQSLLKNSLLSGYPLSGIRFYGIGNEYLGTLCGFLLGGMLRKGDSPHTKAQRDKETKVGASLALPNTQHPIPDTRHLTFVSLLLALLCGLPNFGANAGSFIISTVGIGGAWFVLHGKKLTPKHGVGLALLGFALALVVSAVEARLMSAEASHLGAALQGAKGGGIGSLVGIAVRKLSMNLRLLVTPSFLATVGLMWFVFRFATRRVRAEISLYLSQTPQFEARLPVVFYTSLATLIFKDSGVVAVTFLLATLALTILCDLLRLSAASLSEKSEV